MRALSTARAVWDDRIGLNPQSLDPAPLERVQASPPELKRGLGGSGYPASGSKGGDHLCPNRDHAKKQRQRGQCGSFFNDGPDHNPTPAQQNKS